MDQIAPELLMALAGGTAGAAGQQIWTSLRDLVRRRPQNEDPVGDGELAALAQASDDEWRARQLSEVLALRARQDPAFAQALAAWRQEAEALAPTGVGSGDVHNEISGGTVHGNVVLARDIHGSIHFGNQGSS